MTPSRAACLMFALTITAALLSPQPPPMPRDTDIDNISRRLAWHDARSLALRRAPHLSSAPPSPAKPSLRLKTLS